MTFRRAEEAFHLVGRLERGDQLPESLLRACAQHSVRAAWLSGLGAVEWVELAEYDQSEQRYTEPRRYDAPFEILKLVGNLSLKDGELFSHLHVVLSRETRDGVEVIGGHLVRASVFACELHLTCFRELELHRELDEATGLYLWKSEIQNPWKGDTLEEGAGESGLGGTQEAQPGLQAATSWSAVGAALSAQENQQRMQQATQQAWQQGWQSAAAKAQLAQGSTEAGVRAVSLGPRELKRGDTLDHPRFGTCHVQGTMKEGGVRIRLADGSHKTIKLAVFEIAEASAGAPGKRQFVLKPKSDNLK